MVTGSFILDPRLIKNSIELLDLSLSKVLLHNNALFPWIILVPKRPNIREIIDLAKEDQATLMDEIAVASQVMQEAFTPYKLNVAALGNKVEQLHIHIIARYQDDTAWPDPAFGKDMQPYTLEAQTKQTELLRDSFKEAIANRR